jgi:hypothetical protein
MGQIKNEVNEMQYEIELSRDRIADAIVHNNAVASGMGADEIGVFVYPSGGVRVQAIGRGTDYGETLILDPRAFAETTDDDTYQYANEAHEELVLEGRIRNVPPLERTDEEENAVTELVGGWLQVYRENMQFHDRIEDEEDTILITWTT